MMWTSRIGSLLLMLLAAMSISGALSLIETEANAPLEEATRRTQWLKALFEAHLLDLQDRRAELLSHLSRDPELSTALRTSRRRRPPLEPILHRLVSPYKRGAWVLLSNDGEVLAQINSDETLNALLSARTSSEEEARVGGDKGRWLFTARIEDEDQGWWLAHAYPIPVDALERFSQRLLGEFKWIFFVDKVPHVDLLDGAEIPVADPYPTEIKLDGALQAIWLYPLKEVEGLEVGLLTPALPFHEKIETHPLALLRAARVDLRRTVALMGLFLAAWILIIAWSERQIREPLARLANELKAERTPQTQRYPSWLHPLLQGLAYAGTDRKQKPIAAPPPSPEPSRVPTEAITSLPSRVIFDEEARQTAKNSALDERDTEVVEALDGDLEERFQSIFKQFIDIKSECGESTHSLDYLKFRSRLINTRSSLIERFDCIDVRFRVYVKDNKAALKAAPVLESELDEFEG